jgi:hypothetical protein
MSWDSSDVVAGADTLATDYNNLRSDLTSSSWEPVETLTFTASSTPQSSTVALTTNARYKIEYVWTPDAASATTLKI